MIGDLVTIDKETNLGRGILASSNNGEPYLSPDDDAVYEVLAEKTNVSDYSWVHYTRFKDIKTGMEYECELRADRFRKASIAKPKFEVGQIWRWQFKNRIEDCGLYKIIKLPEDGQDIGTMEILQRSGEGGSVGQHFRYDFSQMNTSAWSLETPAVQQEKQEVIVI